MLAVTENEPEPEPPGDDKVSHDWVLPAVQFTVPPEVVMYRICAVGLLAPAVPVNAREVGPTLSVKGGAGATFNVTPIFAGDPRAPASVIVMVSV